MKRRSLSWEPHFFETLFDQFPEAAGILDGARGQSADRIDGTDAMYFLARELLPRRDDSAGRLLALTETLLESDDERVRDFAEAVVGRLVFDPSLRRLDLPSLVEAAVRAELDGDPHVAPFVAFANELCASVPELRPAFERAFFLASGVVLTTTLMDFVSTNLLERQRAAMAGSAEEADVIRRSVAVVERWLDDPHVYNVLRQTFIEDVAYSDEVDAWNRIAGPLLREAVAKWTLRGQILAVGGQHGNGVSREAVEDAERHVGRLPDDYRNFLELFGWVSVGANEIYGLGDDLPPHRDLVHMTKVKRDEPAVPVPPHFVPIMNNGGGDLYCLDTRAAEKSGASPVFLWAHDLDVDQTPDEVAPSFSAWLLDEIDAARAS